MLLEEAYEAFDAMEEAHLGRFDNLREELGDLLFQITFFARVAKEKGEFTIDDVITQVHEKMVRRHPHVFGDTTARDSAEVLRNWEAIKAEEKRAAGKGAGHSRVNSGRCLNQSAGVNGSTSNLDQGGPRWFRLEERRRDFREDA
jgi:uncharacterized protein YabN with tetrapyrrole methylase and pyrophosphatase domain